VRRICSTVAFVAGALVAFPADASWVTCPEAVATSDRVLKLSSTPAAPCFQDGTSRIKGEGDADVSLGWITLDKASSGAGVTEETTIGGATMNPLAWAAYSQLVREFRSSEARVKPGWAAFTLPANVGGTWKISKDGMSQGNRYAKPHGNPPAQQPPVPEPATLALFGTGLGVGGWLARKRMRRLPPIAQ
jgi:hypothetical protein